MGRVTGTICGMHLEESWLLYGRARVSCYAERYRVLTQYEQSSCLHIHVSVSPCSPGLSLRGMALGFDHFRALPTRLFTSN